MKIEKGKVTRIITQITNSFPDGENIFGYEGISKAKILKSLEQTYIYLGLLDDHEDEIESIWVKRKFAKYYDEVMDCLKKIGSDKWNDLFNDFLERIAKMRSLAKDLYITLTNNPLRIDEELQQAREQLAELIESCKGLEEKIELIEKGEETTVKITDSLATLESSLKDNTLKTAKLISDLEENNELIEKAEDKANEVIPKIEKLKTDTETLFDSQKTLTKEASELFIKVASGYKNIEDINGKLNDQIQIDDDIQKKIKETLSDVNKHGMAGAFLKRKNELKSTVLLWGISSIISMAALVIVSYLLANELIANPSFDPIKNLFKIPSVIAGVWLCWFCAKQFGYTIRIREDYSFKYAISMAFEGYKKETREVNQEMLEQLLQLTILSVSVNPVSLYDTKSNHGSPMQETMEAIRRIFKIEFKGDVKADINKLVP